MKSNMITRVFLLAVLSATVIVGAAACSAHPTLSYSIVFNGQGATVEADPVFVSDITVLEALPSPPQKTGFTFIGWYIDADGDGDIQFDTDADDELTSGYVPSNDMTVYAKWQEIL